MTAYRKNTMPLVTVIIPIYNTEKYLHASAESVLNQDYPNLEVILVDDGSLDGSPALCDALAKEYPQISVIHKKNGGLSSARNAGLDNMSGDTKYVLFLDSDDTLPTGVVSGLVNKALETEADIVMPDRYTKVQESTGQTELAFHFPKNCYMESPRQFALQVVMEKGRAWRATALLYAAEPIRKNAVRFPVGYTSEDIVFNLTLYLYVKKIAFYPFSTLNCLKRDNSITTSFQNGFEKTIYYIDNCVREFLEKANLTDKASKEKANALLCRNIVVYLFSIMSSKNNMTILEKKEYAYRLINENEKVLREKHTIPYFESKKVTMLLKVIYTLLRMGCFKMVVTLLSIIPN